MKYMSMETLRYLLHEVHNVEEVLNSEYYADYDKEMIDMFLDSVKDFADKECYPTLREMDEQPAHYKDGKIIVHPSLEKVIPQCGELGLIGGSFSFEHGGMQMPEMMAQAGGFIIDAANNNVIGYGGLTAGSAHLITAFGSQELIDTYTPKMFTGEWSGTMCLTEPQAGSSLSDVVTSATPQADGSYKIKGQKIFISGGDHEYSDNFVHLVLARIDGAPAGTKGISLMVVPKKRLTASGALEPNDVITAGDFQKLGQKGYCTTHLSFGENDDCQGWVVGKPNNGLRYMFQMMNEARISVGRGGVGIATAAYYASLQYANERPQGRALSSDGTKDVNKGQTLIINHPDVRRMLLLQKAVSEGALSLIFQASKYIDLIRTSEGKAKEDYHDLLELITPIVKTYPSEMGRVSVSNGLQVLGGYGFCSEFVLQQYYRDIRIMAIYEGTTGIQSLDLLGRKMTMKGGKAVKLLSAEIMETINAASTFDELKPYAKVLGDKLKQTQEIMAFLMPYAAQGNFNRFLSDATIFMEFFSTVVIGWQWLKLATEAKKALVTGNMTQRADFYEGKVHTMKFYYKYEMPKTAGCAATIMSDDVLTLVEEKELIA